MTALVVDASVAVKWLFPEAQAETARHILKRKRELLAPDLIWTEVASAIFKKSLRGEITADEAEGVLEDFKRYPIKTFQSKPFVNTAFRVACEADVSVYDALYLALSYNHDCSLITADRRFYDKIHKVFPQSEMLWLEDLKA